MKILIGTYVLVEGLRDSDEEPSSTAAQQAQVVFPLRSADALVIPRGNRVFTFTFAKTRDHGSFQEAERFRLLHITDLPDSGALQFVTEGEGGTEASVWFTSHNVDEVQIRQLGCATITTYRITAAGPTTERL